MYGKIFESMYDGTLSADWKAMIVFQQMIVLANSEGVVDYTPPALARRTGIPLDIIEHGISKLQEPDKYSRSSEHEGRRIILIDDHRDWGWYIVNHDKYQKMVRREDKLAADRERIAEKRKNLKNQECRNLSQNVASVANVAHEAKDEAKAKSKDVTTTPAPSALAVVNDGLSSQAWEAYLQNRRELRCRRLTETGMKKQMAHLAKFPEEVQIAAVAESVRNGWQGVFPEKVSGAAKTDFQKNVSMIQDWLNDGNRPQTSL